MLNHVSWNKLGCFLLFYKLLPLTNHYLHCSLLLFVCEWEGYKRQLALITPLGVTVEALKMAAQHISKNTDSKNILHKTDVLIGVFSKRREKKKGVKAAEAAEPFIELLISLRFCNWESAD